MLTFEKIQEIVELIDNFGGHLLVRHLKPSKHLSDLDDTEIIEDVIKSKYHYWSGEKEPSGLTVGMTSTDKYKNVKSWTLTNHKSYGFFDNSKITASHYKKVTFENFERKLFALIRDLDEGENIFNKKAQTIIATTLNPSATFYHLDLDEKINIDMVAEWQVYSFFIAFISIDKQKNIVTLIEFGQD